MNKVDFTNYKFRSSFLPTLMTPSKLKGEVLSKTAQSGLREIWIKEIYNREKFDTASKYTEKGIMCEPDAMDLVEKVTGKTHFKNKTEFENEFIKGTPDIVLKWLPAQNKVLDIKCSWDIWTFNKVDEKYARDTYYEQMLGYMWLTNSLTADLIFCLVNTPEEIMNDELRRLSYDYPEINESDEKTERFKRNYIYDDIPAEDRLKSIVIEFNVEDIEAIKEKVIAAREFLKGLSL